MTEAQIHRTSALNLRARAKIEANQERAAAWLKEADELDALATKLEASKTANSKPRTAN